jgi:N-acyl-D-aspartate/D-glutamate deacylase
MFFRKLLAVLVVVGALNAHSLLFAQNFDLLIRHGSVFDGSGSAAQNIDIGITGDRIVFLGDGTGKTAKRVIDARGLVVAPGFIDPHTHTLADLSSPATSRNDAYLMQGVTTVVTGNDGSSPIDIGATLAQWKKQGIGTNAALFIGQGSVRRAVMGMSAATPTPQQIVQMQKLVERAMEEGAIGISTGLYYAPGSYSSTEEVIALTKIAAAHGGIYDTHMRDESSYTIGLLASVQETIRIGRETGILVNISHIKALGKDVWGKSTDVIAMIDAARASGVRVTANQYPYTASGTSVVAALVPRWAEADGRDAMLKRIDDSSIRPRLIAEMTRNLERRGGAGAMLICSSTNKQIVGKTLEQIAQQRKESPIDAALEIVKAGDAGVASFNMQESDIKNFMRQDWVMTGSDGSPGHPRKYGTFPMKLRKYVFDEHVISLPFAIRSSTSLTAQTLGLKDRGLLKTGYYADVVVFDPKTINQRATYVDPTVLSTGVRYLTVNGKLAVDGGELTNVLAGRPLTH